LSVDGIAVLEVKFIARAISPRSALPLPAWLPAHGESIVLLSEKTVQSFPALQKVLVSKKMFKQWNYKF
jgi:hypothetical protein